MLKVGMGKNSVAKEADLREVFGSLKTKIKGQEFKDFVRKGWD